MIRSWPCLSRGLPLLFAVGAGILGCGRKDSPAESLETPEYWKWRQTQLPIPAANFAPEVPGRIVVQAPEGRSKNPQDFCEIFFQGSRLYRAPVGRMPSGNWPKLEIQLKFLTGPTNWIDLWDSSSNRNYRHQIDTREGTEITFKATADGFEVLQSKSP